VGEAVGHPSVLFWVDAETGLRSGDGLDLRKVNRYLDAARPYLHQSF
jgi:hypothetical protein